jgi:hypothetical protein
MHPFTRPGRIVNGWGAIMDRQQFWAIIDASRRQADGDPEAQVETLCEQLEALSPDEIGQFQEFYDEFWSRAYRWDLWGAAYLIGGGCSDDGFMDFRAWLISRGEKVFEAAVKDAESLASAVTERDGECQFEGMQYVASQVWEEKTGRDMSEFPRPGPRQPPRPAGEAWAEEGEDLKRRFPRLWERFGYD